MRRGWVLLLCLYLLVWLPVSFANELFSTLSSLAMRGSAAIAELIFHGLSAAIGATAGWMVLVRNPIGVPAAAAAVTVAWLATLQSLFWTVLPRQLAPGERLPYAVLASAFAVFWLVMLKRGWRWGI